MIRLRDSSAIAALVLLSACGASSGGGGVNSGGTTPPPSTGTPPPTPTPTPNVALLAPLTSESFTNDAASGSVSYPTSGLPGTSTAASSNLTVSYDASTGSYTISRADRSQAFRPADRDAALSSSTADVFVRTNGSTSDSLTLTKPSATPGALSYKYVGAGYWQRTVTSSSTISGSFDAFTYGVETPDAALPRTGAASYGVDLLGTAAYSHDVRAVSGSGTLQADFVNGLIRIDGTARELDAQTGMVINPYMAFYSQSALSSANNSFGGAFRYYMDGSPIRSPFDGTISGRFYGPAAEEVGGTFSARNDEGSSVVGTLTGARSGTGANLSLTNLNSDQQFEMPTLPFANAAPHGWIFYGFSNMLLRYKASTQSWEFQPNNLFGDDPNFGPSNRNASLSNARYTVYDVTNADGTFRLTLYNPGSGNDQLALSYASFGSWKGAWQNFPGYPVTNGNYFFAFGQKTPRQYVPTSGSARYAGIIAGEAGGMRNSYTVGGTSLFDLNFGSGAFTVTLRPTGVETTSGTSVDFGTFVYTGNGIGPDMYAYDSGHNVAFRGFLAGPNGEEIGGTFQASRQDPLDPTSSIGIIGATVAKRCPTTC